VLDEVEPADVVTFAGAIAAATAVVLLGSCVAARSAARIDPLVALRD
jgi:ABC-type antimicrobial peptide transport system permease subunit